MKILLIFATLAFVAVQLIHAAPAPEDEKKEVKEAVAPAASSDLHDAAPAKPEAKVEVAGVTQFAEDKSGAQAVRATEVAEKAQ